MNLTPFKDIIDLFKYKEADFTLSPSLLSKYKVSFFENINPYFITNLTRYKGENYNILNVTNGLVLSYSDYKSDRECMIVVDTSNKFYFPVKDTEITSNKTIFKKEELLSTVVTSPQFYSLYRHINFVKINPIIKLIEDEDVEKISDHVSFNFMSWDVCLEIRKYMESLYKWVLKNVDNPICVHESEKSYWFKISIVDDDFYLEIPYDRGKKKIEITLFDSRMINSISCDIEIGFFQSLFDKTVENKLGHISNCLRKEERILHKLRH